MASAMQNAFSKSPADELLHLLLMPVGVACSPWQHGTLPCWAEMLDAEQRLAPPNKGSCHSQHCAVTAQCYREVNVCHCSIKGRELRELLLVHSTLHKHLPAGTQTRSRELVTATQVTNSLPNMHSSAHQSRHQQHHEAGWLPAVNHVNYLATVHCAPTAQPQASRALH
jgi:hypothetical protein